jgi:hypothetical protein
MHRFFAATGRFAVRFRWAVVAAWVVATVLASLFLPSLTSVAKQNNTDLLPASSPSLHAARLATPFQGPNQTPVSVAQHPGRGHRPDADLRRTASGSGPSPVRGPLQRTATPSQPPAPPTPARPPRRQPLPGTDPTPACPRRPHQRVRVGRIKAQVAEFWNPIGARDAAPPRKPGSERPRRRDGGPGS